MFTTGMIVNIEMMKKMMINNRNILIKLFSFILITSTMFSLVGCSKIIDLAADNNISTLNSWSFQYNEGTKDFSLFFGLKNKSGKFISSDVKADIRIVNDKDEEVYNGSKYVTTDDFANFTSINNGAQYLAELRIPENEIKQGKSSNGTVYLTIYKDDILLFEEVNCSVLYSLKVKDFEITSESLPVTINIKGYDGSIESELRIDKVTFTTETILSSTTTVTVSGVKTYGNNKQSYDMISYKLYDSQDYVAKTGNLWLSSLGKEDKFKDDSIVFYDLIPGEKYTIKFFEYR